MGYPGEPFVSAIRDNCPSVPRELELINRIQAGENELLPELLAPHLARIRSVAMVILRNHSEAEDVIQDTVLKVMLHLNSVRSSDCFGHWVLQIARNEARTRLRKERKHLFEPLDHGDAEQEEPLRANTAPADPRPDPLASVEERELVRALALAVASLQQSYREVWQLAGAGEWKIAEIAEKLGITEANAMSRLRRARNKLREILAPLLTQCAICHQSLELQQKQAEDSMPRVACPPARRRGAAA